VQNKQSSNGLFVVLSSVKDEGGPFEVGFQEQASNHFKWLSLKVMVISVERKAGVELWQVWIKKMNELEPLWMHRKPEVTSKPGV